MADAQDETDPTDGPSVVVIAGPNGAGKSTVAPVLLQDVLGVGEFVNADTIARGLSEFNPESVAIAAGRIMLKRLHELGRERATLRLRQLSPVGRSHHGCAN